MTPVFPYLVRRSEDGWHGELLLRLKEGKSVYVVHLSMEQARVLAVEMRGLATDHCPQHHLALLLARSLGANISHVVIQRVGADDEVLGVLRLVTADGLRSVNVDAAAGLAMAIHIGLPIFMDGEFDPIDGPYQKGSEIAEPPTVAKIPQAFRDVIERLEMPESGNETAN